jgi:Sap, sulfolipid-1-addressing protein
MLAQATGFAFLAAISPTALVVMAVFLGSASPRQTAIAYATGAFIMTVLMAAGVLLVIRAVGLDQPRQHDPRYGVRLGLGVIALASAAVVTLRRPRQGAAGTAGGGAGGGSAGQGGSARGLMSRLVAHPSPRTAFIAGLILFAPSATFIAAVQVVASARTGTPVTLLALVIVVALSALTAWAPLVAYLLAPAATERRLRALNGWLRARGKKLVILALMIAGVALVINGALGLAHVL